MENSASIKRGALAKDIWAHNVSWRNNVGKRSAAYQTLTWRRLRTKTLSSRAAAICRVRPLLLTDISLCAFASTVPYLALPLHALRTLGMRDALLLLPCRAAPLAKARAAPCHFTAITHSLQRQRLPLAAPSRTGRRASPACRRLVWRRVGQARITKSALHTSHYAARVNSAALACRHNALARRRQDDQKSSWWRDQWRRSAWRNMPYAYAATR